MTPETLAALKASIAKWKRNAVAKTPEEYLIGAANCPLCVLFKNSECLGGWCIGCPVFEATGNILCDSTPYDNAHDAHTIWLDNDAPLRHHVAGVEQGRWAVELLRDDAHRAALAEVAFLESLLPDEDTA